METISISSTCVGLAVILILCGIAVWLERIDLGDKRWILNHDGKTFRRPGEEDPYYSK